MLYYRTAYVMGDKLKMNTFNRVIVKLHSIRPNPSQQSLIPLYQASYVRGHNLVSTRATAK